jgi:hypothetical protein
MTVGPKTRLFFLQHVAVIVISTCLHMHNPLNPCSMWRKMSSATPHRLRETNRKQNAAFSTNILVAPKKMPHPHKEKNDFKLQKFS